MGQIRESMKRFKNGFHDAMANTKLWHYGRNEVMAQWQKQHRYTRHEF